MHEIIKHKFNVRKLIKHDFFFADIYIHKVIFDNYQDAMLMERQCHVPVILKCSFVKGNSAIDKNIHF